MFCPECGIEDKLANQFCRACGSDLGRVRDAVATFDNVTAAAASARQEIGRAIAAKIRDTRSAEELSVVAEEVLPEIEKFLESPEEKRLRRLRAGIIFSSIGIGITIGTAIAGILMKEEEILFLGVFGVVAFFIGLGIVLNGILLTVPKKELQDRSPNAERQRRLDAASGSRNDLSLPESSEVFWSVTENTTQHLKEKEPVSRGKA